MELKLLLLAAAVLWGGGVSVAAADKPPDDTFTSAPDRDNDVTVTAATVKEHVDATVASDADVMTQSPDTSNMTSPRGLHEGHEVLIGELPFFYTDPYHGVPYVAVLAFGLTSGIFGNTLIIRTLIITNKLKVLGNEFILNLALADLCITCISDPVCLLGVLKGKEFFMKYPWFCDLVACLCLATCFCSFFNLSAVTLNRYLFVNHNQTYHKLFTHRRIVVMCIIIWFAAFIFEMPNFLGWGNHFFDEKNHQCIWDRTASFSYTLFVTVGLIGGPLLLMTLAYLSIFRYIYRIKRNVFRHGDSSGGSGNQKDVWRKQWSEVIKYVTSGSTREMGSDVSCRTLMAVVVMYLVCWTPYVFIVALDTKNRFPVWMHLWATLLAHLHSSTNWIVYALSSDEYRKGFMYALGCSTYKEGKYTTHTDSSASDMKKTKHSNLPNEKWGKTSLDSHDDSKLSFDSGVDPCADGDIVSSKQSPEENFSKF